MTDRELLDAAAKAAGMKKGTCFDEYGDLWNPLTDDGDALRLAVKLQLTVCNEQLSAGVAYCIGCDGDIYPAVSAMTDTGGALCEADYAATRRAIVRAAAEIGSTT
ncbi:MAG: hypothetical protein RJA55_2334 [Acidobacteriota bacterium]|jgi:hypothetical protein